MGTNAPDPNQPIPAAPAPDPNKAPQWATDLMAKIDALPGKLVANVDDEQGDRIAEKVHGLFEKSGAFIKGDEPPAPPAADPDGPPEQVPGAPPGTADAIPEKGDSIARKLFGRW